MSQAILREDLPELSQTEVKGQYSGVSISTIGYRMPLTEERDKMLRNIVS
jgi:hypothetical protein